MFCDTQRGVGNNQTPQVLIQVDVKLVFDRRG